MRDVAGANFGDAQDMAKWKATTGEASRNLKQQQIDTDYNNDKDALSWYTNIFNSTKGTSAPGSSVQNSTQPAPSGFQQLAGTALQAAGTWAMMGSDERIKEDIDVSPGKALEKIRGLRSYSYRYKNGEGHTRDRTTGLMAQDLEKSGITGAVQERSDGIKMVDPYPVLATVIDAVRELDERTKPRMKGLD
jgi:hypothetical protein